MFEVKVTVEIPGLPEAIHALAGALSNNPVSAKAVQEKNANEPIAFVNPNAGQQAVVPPSGVIAGATPDPAANPTQPATNVPDAVATTAPTGPAQTSSHSEAKTFTMDDLGKAGATLIDAGKMPQLIALLGKFGVQAVTQLKPEQFNAFADEMRALGAKF